MKFWLQEIGRLARMVGAFAVCAFGIYLSIHANVGLAPWDAFAVGLAGITGKTYGLMNILTGLSVMAISVGFFREKFGVATVLNTLLIGTGVDILESFNLVPYLQSFGPGVLMMLVGQFFMCVGTVLYIPIGMGGGPRDSLMLALARRFPNARIGLIRGGIEGAVLFCGWLMGAPVGIGTVMAVFGISSLLQFTCFLFRSNLKGTVHESCLGTLRRWRNHITAGVADAR
ncbi:MAG: hypothetical protein DBX44_00020 [Oscillospiraceae bacterium]|nr:MAG: hypothetical protein DBX44_00020 [Oscillospiraceae bacterium]